MGRRYIALVADTALSTNLTLPYLDEYNIFKSDLINDMNHMRISDTEPSSVILSLSEDYQTLLCLQAGFLYHLQTRRSRSSLLQSRGPQFSESACFDCDTLTLD